MVAIRSRVFAIDEGLGKRDDDHRPPKMGNWNVKHKPPWRKRRIALIVVACFGVWLFIHYIPTDLGPVDRQTGRHIRPGSRASPEKEAVKAWDTTHGQTQPETPQPQEAPRFLPHDYDGPVKFYYLASTLRAAERARDADVRDRDVLFAASNLNSAGAVIPMACEMARWKRNTVHMAIMGRSELSLDEIKQINGAPREACNIWWHDARPDFMKTSTDDRMEVSVAGAIGHINTFVHPAVVITTDLDYEDTFFAHGVKRKLRQQFITHIQVPKDDPESMSWATRLDSASLKSWHTASIDLLVQAPLDSSGSLIRLLKSLSAADYSGFTPPRLTIELPHTVDTITAKFLSRFRWPPVRYATPGQNDQLTIRRRIFEQRMSVDEASQRFIESFYPSSPKGPHVLVLSPQTELSPVYFHYAKLLVLEYRHSSSISEIERSLFGISLETPSVHLDGVTPFKSQSSMDSNSDNGGVEQSRPFQWQAPNTNAALYFGDKWMELHSFLLRRHSAARHPTLKSHYQSEKKIVTEKSPAWSEYMLQLMRNRGYFLHYPGSQLASSLAVVHNELYQLPEEFAKNEDDMPPTVGSPSSEEILTVKDDYLESHHPSASQKKLLNFESQLLQKIDLILPQSHPSQDTQASVLESTPGAVNSDLRQVASEPAIPRLSALPLLDYNGKTTSYKMLHADAATSAITFRTAAGGCSSEQSKKLEAIAFSAEDLFCFDMRESDWTMIQPPSSGAPQEFDPGRDHDAEAGQPHDTYENDDDDDKDMDGLPGKAADTKPLGTAAGLEDPKDANEAKVPPLQDAKHFLETTLASMKDSNPVAKGPSDTDSLPVNKKTDKVAPTGGDTAAEHADSPGQGDTAKEGEGPAFPVLDGSKIQAFDEGREVDRDAPKASTEEEAR